MQRGDIGGYKRACSLIAPYISSLHIKIVLKMVEAAAIQSGEVAYDRNQNWEQPEHKRL